MIGTGGLVHLMAQSSQNISRDFFKKTALGSGWQVSHFSEYGIVIATISLGSHQQGSVKNIYKIVALHAWVSKLALLIAPGAILLDTIYYCQLYTGYPLLSTDASPVPTG
jgi:uncharacterized protein YdeI (YjbR/CyaY-like superfamily)